MKYSLTLGIILVAFSTAAMADTHSHAKPDGHKTSGKMCKKGYLKHKFKKIDTNNDGAISKAESQAYHDKKFSKKDANNDGKITKEEFKAYRHKKMKKMKEMHGKMPKHGKAPADKQ